MNYDSYLARAIEIFNDKMDADFSRDNVILTCFMTDDQEEIFEQFCAQYFPYRLKDRYQEEGYFDFRASSFIGMDNGGTYHYELQGEEREYHAYFKEPTRPPVYLYLYYLDNPRKLFSVEEYHYENHKAILLLPVIFLPWILALAAMFLLNIPLPTR